MSELVLQWLTGRGLGLPMLAFSIAGAAVFLAGARLARHADAIADATGIGRMWIGALLLAASTSLPELTTDLNAALLGAIDVGVGDLMGSTLANVLILGVLDLTHPRRRLLDQVSRDVVPVAAVAIVLTAMAGIAITIGGFGRAGHVGLETIGIVLVYLFGMRVAYRSSSATTVPPEQLEIGSSSEALLWRGIRGFAVGVLALLVSAPLLVLSANAIALESGTTETFVGTVLVGITTSLPEIAATVAALRLGAIDLAVGNIFGSNAFNMCILLVMDAAYTPGPVLVDASQDHALSAQLAVMAIAFAMLGVLAGGRPRAGAPRIESWLIVAAYAGAVYLLGR